MTAPSTPTSIQASLTRWFALQTLVGPSAVCTVVYALTAWSFELKQDSEFERHVELVVHLLQEPRSDSQQLALHHELDDFFRSHNDIGIVLSADAQTVYESGPAGSSTRWRWRSTDLKDVPQLGADPKLWLGVDVREDEKLLHRLGLTLLGVAVLGSMLVSLTGVLLVRRGLRPLRQLAVQLAATGPEFSNLEESRRLSTIVTDMLFLSKSDRGATARRSEPVSLAAQVSAVAEFHEAELEQAGLQVRVEGDAMARIDMSLVRRALSNLLSNAVCYATPQTTIEIRIEASQDTVWLRVTNCGAEVAGDALPHLFKRFFRAERSRSRSSAHHGLGLAIVAAIARMHGGETSARSAGGTTEISFSVREEPAREAEPTRF